MSVCFLFAANTTHIRVYKFRKRPEGHCLFVGSVLHVGQGADICIATDIPSVIPTLPGYITDRPHDDMKSFSTKHPFVWKNITKLYNDVGRMLILRGRDVVLLRTALYKKELEAIRNDHMKLEILAGSLKTVTGHLRANEDAG